MRRLVAVVAAVGVVLSACSPPQAVPDVDTGAAEAAFVACAARYKVAVEEVRIGGGDFHVRVADDAPREAVAKVQQECEPLALEALTRQGAGSPSSEVPQVPAGVTDVEAYVEHLEEQRFAGVVLVEEDDDVSTVHAFGLADRDDDVANTEDTAFDIASIAKTFTAVAVLRLVDARDLSLDDTLGHLLEDVPSDKRQITVRQLLDFSSGLGEYHDSEGDFQPMTREQAREAILDQQLLFAPGSKTAYSNSSYTLAALIVEEVTGRPFTQVVTQLFADAGLSATGFYGSPTLQEITVASGYEGRHHGADNSPAAWEATWALLGSGGIASTAGDLQRWWHQLQQPGLLSADSVQVLLDELVPAEQIDGVVVRGVGGTNDYGFDALIAHVPDENVLVVVLSNANPPDRTIATETGFVFARLVLAEDGR